MIHYFGAWATRVNGLLVRVEGDGWREALAAYQAVADDLHARRTPPRQPGRRVDRGRPLQRFLTAKTRKMEAGELTARYFAEYKEVAVLLAATVRATRRVDDLAADDFAQLRQRMARKWGPVRLANGVIRVRSIFKFGYESGLMDRTARYGPEFKKPDNAVLRRHKAKQPAKMFEAEEIREMIDGAMVPGGDEGPELARAAPPLRAMILLGINAGLGSMDCATLKEPNIDLERG